MGAIASCCIARDTTPTLTGNEVLRITKQNFKPGKGKEAEEVSNKMFDLIGKKWPDGLLDAGMSSSATSIFGFQVYESKEALEKYKSGLRTELMEKMKPVIDGAPAFDLVGSVIKAHKGCPNPRSNSMVVRIIQIDYKEELSDDEIDKIFDDAWPTMCSAKGMTVWSAWADKKKKQAIVGFVFQDQASLDAYKTDTREAMMKLVGSSMKNPAVVHEVGTLSRPDVYP